MSKTYVEKVPISRRIWSFITAVVTSLSFMLPSFDLGLVTNVSSEGYTSIEYSAQAFDPDGTVTQLPSEYTYYFLATPLS